MDTDCLKSVKVPLISTQECKKMYQDSNSRIKLSKGMMCAGYAHGGADACDADSGGPLTCEMNGKNYGPSDF